MGRSGSYIGIDGGGSSTRLLLRTGEGHTLSQKRGGPSNVLVVGEDRARQNLLDLLPAEPVDVLVAGLAGADRPAVRRLWRGVLSPYASQCWVVGDYRIAWAAATDGQPGLIAIVGTGSIVYAEHAQATARVGGYGWRVGDAASGFALGRSAVKAVLAALEQWGPATALQDAVAVWADGVTARQILDHVYDPQTDWRSVADLAPTVLDLARSDAVAREIVRQHGATLARYMQAGAEAVSLPASAIWALSGGLASRWLPYLKEVLGSHPKLVVSLRDPVEGATRLAQLWHDSAREAQDD
jgi:glucosamine kinase